VHAPAAGRRKLEQTDNHDLGAEFLLREGESRELLGSWIRSGAVPEAKKRRAKQVITCSFPCGQWLHMIGARANPRCELCRRERETRGASIDSLLTETVAHIQSAGCNLQKKSVIGAHNRCWKYLIGAISTHGEAKRSLEVLGGDKDRQLHTLWKETKIKQRKNSLQKGERKGKPQAVTRLANNEMTNQKEMKKNHLRKSFSDKGDLTLWRSIGPTKWCTS